MKHAIIVCGPESSGTRLMASIIEAGGAERDDTMRCSAENIVIHRSVPHGGEMPDLAGMVNRLRGRGYTAQAVVMVRDPFATAQSQVQAGHSADLNQAHVKQQKALVFIMKQFDMCRCGFVVVPYASLITRPTEIQEQLAAYLNLETTPQVEVYDGNEKYYAA